MRHRNFSVTFVFPSEIKMIDIGRGNRPHSSNYTYVKYIIRSVYFGCLLKVLLF